MPPSTPKVGINDLKTLFPGVALQAYGWDPSTVRFGSGLKKEWKCVRSHIYEMAVSQRTSKKPQGCPYCSGRRVLKGFNDLQTLYPEIAKEAYGWDPTTFPKGGTTKVDWICPRGHIYSAPCNDRTNKQSGCPYCSGNRVLQGFNDLKTKFPDIAEYAEGWDATTVLPGCNEERTWICDQGHKFKRTVYEQVAAVNKCKFCPQTRRSKTITGINDLATTHPKIAEEADGWDPREYTPGSNYKMEWRCKKGHPFEQAIQNRTLQGQGCPYCSNRYVWKGFNDLQTKFPMIAMEASGWDPSEVLWGSAKSTLWECPKGHIYEATINMRTMSKKGVFAGTGCPVCAGRIVLAGFNDLQTHYPEIAREAYEWDPTTKTRASSEKVNWKCLNGHIYPSTIGNRTSTGAGCPVCCEYGFNPQKDTWLYLMYRPGEQQFGITNVPQLRKRQHASVGWTPLDWYGPAIGYTVLEIETELKRWLRNTYEPIEGKTENWETRFFEVQSLKHLCEFAGIDIRNLPRDISLM